MKIETYVNAMVGSLRKAWEYTANQETIDSVKFNRRIRQYNAFYSRILRKFEELETELESESNWADLYFEEWQKATGSEYGERQR
ncbi:MAG: hypothetical protein ACYTE5_10715 [Planctomycetota bacterium]|jgi:hypothetical protein